jgi:hypothetical protein
MINNPSQHHQKHTRKIELCEETQSYKHPEEQDDSLFVIRFAEDQSGQQPDGNCGQQYHQIVVIQRPAQEIELRIECADGYGQQGTTGMIRKNGLGNLKYKKDGERSQENGQDPQEMDDPDGTGKWELIRLGGEKHVPVASLPPLDIIGIQGRIDITPESFIRVSKKTGYIPIIMELNIRCLISGKKAQKYRIDKIIKRGVESFGADGSLFNLLVGKPFVFCQEPYIFEMKRLVRCIENRDNHAVGQGNEKKQDDYQNK